MAGSVLNWTFGFQMNISAKLKVSASKSATSPSCKTLCDMASKITLRNKLHDFEWIKKKLNPDQKCVKTRSEFIFCLTDWIYHGLDLKTDFWHHITNGICAWKQFNASKSLCWKNSDWKSYAKSFRKNFWILAFWNFNCVNKFALDF